MTKDLDTAIASYKPKVEAIAEKLANSPRSKRVGAEFDDLVQEGLLDVWQSLTRGITPSLATCELRMRDWIRYMARQKGEWLPAKGMEQHIPYDQILPLDDYRAAEGS